jgi:hypothetical protein
LHLSAAKHDKLIKEATVDCYNDSEAVTGFFTMIEENLAMPFVTQVLGIEVNVTCIDLTDADQIVEVCTRGGMRQTIPILDLPLPDPPSNGAEWIEAYMITFFIKNSNVGELRISNAIRKTRAHNTRCAEAILLHDGIGDTLVSVGSMSGRWMMCPLADLRDPPLHADPIETCRSPSKPEQVLRPS